MCVLLDACLVKWSIRQHYITKLSPYAGDEMETQTDTLTHTHTKTRTHTQILSHIDTCTHIHKQMYSYSIVMQTHLSSYARQVAQIGGNTGMSFYFHG